MSRAVDMSADPATGRAWFPALTEAKVRHYMLGQGASFLGSWMLDITLNLLVWQLTRSPALLGVLNFLLYGPGVVVTPLLSTRLTVANARRITVRVLAAALAVPVVLSVAALLHGLSLPLLLVAAGVRGVVGGMEIPSRQMLLMNIVDDGSHMGSAIAMNTVVFLLARTLGPALAGLMFEPLGPLCAFALAAAGMAFMLRWVVRLRTVIPYSAAVGSERVGLRGAWAYARKDSFGSLLLPVLAFIAACVGAYQTLVPVLADRVFGDATRWTGWFFAAAGCGALVAALLLSSRHMDAVVKRLLLIVPWWAVLALAGLGFSSRPVPALFCFAILGFCVSFVGTATNATLHARLPAHARGGLIALFLMAFVGVMPPSQLLAGLLAQWLSVQTTFYLLSAVLCLALLTLYGARWRRLGRLELDASRI